MKITLEALSPMEGIGIIRAGHSLRLVRPPYVLHDSPVLQETSLQDAILKHGFVASNKQFSSWEDAIDFLNLQAVESRRALGKEIPESIPPSDLLDVAPSEVITAFLDRVETELIPQRLFDHAENLLLALLASNVPTSCPEMVARAAQLLQRTQKARQHLDATISELASRDLRFPSLEKHHELEKSARLADMIRARGCVFAPAA